MKKRKKLEDLTAEEALKEFESGEPVELAPPPPGPRMSLFTLRLDQGTFQALIELADREGVGPSVLARRILQEGLARRGAELPFDVEAGQVLERILKYGYKPPS